MGPHPWLASHPQHDLARQQMTGGGTVVTFEVTGGGRRRSRSSTPCGPSTSPTTSPMRSRWRCHPATTTHQRIGPQARAAVGITDGTIRLSVGLEDPRDLLDDLDQALRGPSGR